MSITLDVLPPKPAIFIAGDTLVCQMDTSGVRIAEWVLYKIDKLFRYSKYGLAELTNALIAHIPFIDADRSRYLFVFAHLNSLFNILR